MTQVEFDSLTKTVAELALAVKKGQDEQPEALKQAVKDVLASHPGYTPHRKIVFSGIETRADQILAKMPKELRHRLDECYILGRMLKRDTKSLKHWQEFVDGDGREFKKALDTANASQGGDWVPTEFTSELAEDIRLELRVAALFPMIQMPSNPYKLPVQLGRFDSFKHDEQTADTGQTKVPVGDATGVVGNSIMTAVGHASRVLVSKDLEEDSIVPILPFLRSEIVKALADGREDAVLNGDTAGTHEDSDVTSASSRRKLWLGLRAHANDQSYKTSLATFDLAGLRSLRKSMGKYGVMPSQLAILASISDYIQMLSFDNVTTLEKYGPNATVLSGELARIDGIPVIVSEHIRENLNASGVHDGVTTTKTVVHMVYRMGFKWGIRRNPTVKLLEELYAESDQDALVTKERLVFDDLYPIASNKTTWLGYNIAS